MCMRCILAHEQVAQMSGPACLLCIRAGRSVAMLSNVAICGACVHMCAQTRSCSPLLLN